MTSCKWLHGIFSNIFLNVGKIKKLHCGRWNCSECRKKLVDKWIRRAAKAFSGLPLWEVRVCGIDNYESFSRRLRKHGCEYFRVLSGNGLYVFHTPLMSNRKHKANESSWVNGDIALTKFKEVLSLPDVCRVNCSRKYQTSRVKSNSGWALEAKTHKTPEMVNNFLRSVNIQDVVHANVEFDARLLDVILLRDLPDFRRANSPGQSILHKTAPAPAPFTSQESSLLMTERTIEEVEYRPNLYEDDYDECPAEAFALFQSA